MNVFDGGAESLAKKGGGPYKGPLLSRGAWLEAVSGMRLTEHEKHHKVRFANGLSVEILKREGAFGGLGQVKLHRRKLRAAELPVLPLIRTPDGCHVTRLEFEHFDEGDESLAVTMRPFVSRSPVTEWRGQDGEGWYNIGRWGGKEERDRGGAFQLRLKAVNRTVGGIDFVGFSYAYKFRSRKYRVYRIHDRATWEPGGRATGNSFWMCGPFNLPQKTIRSKADRFSTAVWTDGGGGARVFQFLPFFTALQAFTFQFNRQLLLVTVFEKPFHCRSLFEKPPKENYFIHWHQLCTDLAGSLEFPALQVLCAEGEAGGDCHRANQYCAVRQDLQQGFREQLGLVPETAALSGQLVGAGSGPIREAERGLDALARAACQRVYVPGLLRDGAPADGSERALEAAARRVTRLVEHARRRGLEVAVPLGEALLPWVVRSCAPEGPEDAAPASLTEDVWRDKAARSCLLDHMGRLRKRFAVDTLYDGSPFCGMGHEFHRRWPRALGDGADTHVRKGASRFTENDSEISSLLAARTAVVAALQRLGYSCLLCGAGGLIGLIDSSPYAALKYAEFICRDQVLAFPYEEICEAGDEPLAAYFKGLANRLVYRVTCDLNESARGGLEGWWRADYAAINHAYKSVREHMRDSLLLSGARGVLWTGAAPDVRVLWSYRKFQWDVGEGAEVFDVMDHRCVAVQDGRLAISPWRVYLIQNAADP